MKKLLLINEAAEVLRCCPRTVRRMVYSGTLEGLNTRGGLRVTSNSIDEYIRLCIADFRKKCFFDEEIVTGED